MLKTTVTPAIAGMPTTEMETPGTEGMPTTAGSLQQWKRQQQHEC